ncbi:hypothetical protein DVH24_007743 [Malus domestica]|uniref:Uncharacterized protein n=1 Tax=Malus domestica TaxID=3750 RepID=A0A498JR55_MALDO|nr:hypothetical protein DVH24_007743 [Malus domestica]
MGLFGKTVLKTNCENHHSNFWVSLCSFLCFFKIFWCLLLIPLLVDFFSHFMVPYVFLAISSYKQVEGLQDINQLVGLLVPLLCGVPGVSEKNFQVQQQVTEIITYTYSLHHKSKENVTPISSKLTIFLFAYYSCLGFWLLCTYQLSQFSCDLYIHIPYNFHLSICDLLLINSILILKLFLPIMQSFALFASQSTMEPFSTACINNL